MGDMADWVNDQIFWMSVDNDEYERRYDYYPPNTISCKYCGKTCYWAKLKNKWVLFDDWNGMHICPSKFKGVY